VESDFIGRGWRVDAESKAQTIDTIPAAQVRRARIAQPIIEFELDQISCEHMVQPEYGTIYTTSAKKNAEHGGFSFGGTNVALIVSHPGLPNRTVKTPVVTSQVAPTILEALGLEAESLDAVRVEHTPVLPGFGESDD